MSGALLRYHRWHQNLRAAVGEALEADIPWDAPTDHYVAMRMAGESQRMAAMLARREGPALKTDAEFRKGTWGGNQFASCPAVGHEYVSRARAAGIDPAGKVYLRGLARFPGDPGAWVSGRLDVERIASERGWGVSGSVNVARREVEPMANIPVGEDIVSAAASRLMSRDSRMSPEEAACEAAAIRSGQRDQAPPLVSWPSGEGAEQSEEIMT
jgi:hypothetical protein